MSSERFEAFIPINNINNGLKTAIIDEQQQNRRIFFIPRTEYGSFLGVILSTFILTLSSVVSKLLFNLPPWQIAFLRNLAQIPPSVLIYYFVHYRHQYNRELPFSRIILARSGRKLLARGALGALSAMTFFVAVQNLPLGDASAIIFANPVLVAIWAHFFLQHDVDERATLTIIIGLALTVVGVVLVSRPESSTTAAVKTDFVESAQTSGPNFALGLIAAVGAAILISINSILSRSLRDEKATLVMIYYSTIGAAISGGITVFTGSWTPIEGKSTWVLLMALCALGFISQYLIMLSYQLASANTVSLVFTLEIVWAYLMQIVVFGDTPRWLNLLGAFFILFSAALVAWDNLLDSPVKVFDFNANNYPFPSSNDEDRTTTQQLNGKSSVKDKILMLTKF